MRIQWLSFSGAEAAVYGLIGPKIEIEGQKLFSKTRAAARFKCNMNGR